MKTVVKQTRAMGRGIFAKKDFNKGQVVEVSPCLKFSISDNWTIQKTDIKLYVFSDDRNGSVLALGNGSLFNHSNRPNATYKYDHDRNVMVFTATRKIAKGSQIFINYGYDPVIKGKQWELEKKGREEAEKMNNLVSLPDLVPEENLTGLEKALECQRNPSL